MHVFKKFKRMKHLTRTQLIRNNLIFFVVVSLTIFVIFHFFLLGKWLLVETLLSLNSSSLAMFGYDKVGASYQKTTRLPEMFFYIIAALGGSIGILIGSNMFRHKTQKFGFMGRIFMIVIIQAVIVVLIVNARIPELF